MKAVQNQSSTHLLLRLFRFALPAVLAYFISELYNMVDTYYVGHALGEDAVGALGTVFPIQRLVIALSLLFAFGTSNLLAHAMGAQDWKGASQWVGDGLILNGILMLPLTLVLFVARGPLLSLLGAREALFEPAFQYVTIVIWGSFFLAVTTTIARILLTMGHVSEGLFLNASGALLNIVLDHLLVWGYGMGIRGAAIATLCSQVIGAMLAFWRFQVLARPRLDQQIWGWRPSRIGQVAVVGLPSFLVEIEDAVVMAVLNLLVLRAAGTHGVNVLALNTKVYLFLFVIVLGLGYGMQTLIAFFDGENNQAGMRAVLRLTLSLALGSSLLMVLCALWKTESLLSLFVSDGALLRSAVPTFRRMIICLPGLSFYYVALLYAQALARAKLATALTLLRQLGILLPLSAFLVFVCRADLLTVLTAYPVTDVLAMLVGLVSLWILWPRSGLTDVRSVAKG